MVKEFLRYVVVGGISFAADFATIVAFEETLLKAFSWGLYAAVVCGFVVGLAVNYYLSLKFVFTSPDYADRGRSLSAFLAFGVIGLVGLLLTELGMWLGIECLGWNYMVVKILVTGVVLMWNYLGRKLIIFR
mgnify:CR=1 FL=1